MTDSLLPALLLAERNKALEEAALLCDRLAVPPDCECLGPMDPETGVRECSLEGSRGGTCLCAERSEAFEKARDEIRALAVKP